MDRDENEDEVLDEHADGRIENQGEKSEVQGDLQIPSSLVALAPCLLERRGYIYVYKSVYLYILGRYRGGVIARDKKTICGFSSLCARSSRRIWFMRVHRYIGSPRGAIKFPFNAARLILSSVSAVS